MSNVRMPYSEAEIRRQIDAKYQRSIDRANAEYARDANVKARRDEWRTEAEKAIRKLARGLKDLPDAELSGFRIKRSPDQERFSPPENVRDRRLQEATTQRERALGRLEAIRKDDDGTVKLTDTMLSDLFGL